MSEPVIGPQRCHSCGGEYGQHDQQCMTRHSQNEQLNKNAIDAALAEKDKTFDAYRNAHGENMAQLPKALTEIAQLKERIAELEAQVKLHQEAEEANAHEACAYENALIGAKQYDCDFSINIHEKTMERIRELIAYEGQLGDELVKTDKLVQRLSSLQALMEGMEHRRRPTFQVGCTDCWSDCPRCAYEKWKEGEK